MLDEIIAIYAITDDLLKAIGQAQDCRGSDHDGTGGRPILWRQSFRWLRTIS